MTVAEIQEKIRSAPSLDFATIFNESIELFKKSVIHGFVMQIFSLIMVAPIILIFCVPLFVAGMDQMYQTDVYGNPTEFNENLLAFSWVTIVLFILAILVVGTCVSALRAGFIKMLKKLDNDQKVSNKELFYFFTGKYLGKVFILLLVTILISVVALSLIILPLIYAVVPITFFMYVFAFNPDMSVGDIVKVSFNLGTEKWLISFGLFIIAGLLASLVGFIICGIGSIFTAPFVYHPLYFIYKKTIGFSAGSNTISIE